MASGRFHAMLLAALCLAAPPGWAHDSWLSPARGESSAGRLALELSTGNRYPVQEFSTSPASVVKGSCAGAGTDSGASQPLLPLRQQSQWLELESAAGSRKPIACWLELAPAEIEIEPARVEIYFAEIKASAANRDAWAALRARKLPWRESYRKFARIELAANGAASSGELAMARRPAGLDLEIVVLGDRPITAHEPVELQVLRDGLPLADFPVELISERSAIGIWRRTDSRGMLRHSLPFNGRWLLRGTDLRQSSLQPETWESRFVTLALESR